MYKRPIAGILGCIAVIGSFWPAVDALEMFKEIGSPQGSFWPDLAGGILMASIGVGVVWLGIRQLRFALTGTIKESNGWVKPVFLGIGFFIPGFVFSFPVTALFVTHIWPRDEGNLDLAAGSSVCVGVLASVICALLLLRKRNAKRAS